MLETLTPGQIAALCVGLLLAFAGGVNTIGSAVEKFLRVWRAMKAPNDNQNTRLDALERDVRELKGYLAQDKKHLDSLDEGNRVTHQALLALLDHGIDGNNIKQMEDAKADLQHHLINR